MARLINLKEESDIYESLLSRIKFRLGGIYSGQDSTINILSEALGSEIISLRKENETIFNSDQLSNASERDLDNIAFEMYGLQRLSETFAKVSARERNLHFYVEQGSFGDINGGTSISLPEGTLVSTKAEFDDSNLLYQITQSYTLAADENYAYCSAVALNPGSFANVSENSLQNHNFLNYADVLSGTLKVTNKMPIINGRDLESDESLRYRTTNYINAVSNRNRDAVFLNSLQVPGIREVRIIPGYFGIGTIGVIAFGQGKELSKDILDLLEDRLVELQNPGQEINIISGVTVYFDFKLKIYIKSGLTNIEKENIKSTIKRDVANLIKDKEFNNFLDMLEISRVAIRNIPDSKILGFGTSENGGSIFEEVFIRKTDRFNLFPEEKESLMSDFYSIGDDERIAFGEIIVNLEEDIRWVR